MAEKLPTPRVGLLMATYNQASKLKQSIFSLQQQTHSNFTLTIVNDGSSDETQQIINHFEDPRFQLLKTPHTGQIPALNLALGKGKPAHYYAIVYANCHYDPRFLEIMVKTLMEHLNMVGIYCNFDLYFTTNGRSYDCYSEPPFRHIDLLGRNNIGCGFVFRKEFLQAPKNTFIDNHLGLWGNWQRLAKDSPLLHIPQTLVYCNPHDSEYSGFIPSLPKADIHKDIQDLTQMKCLFTEEEEPIFSSLLKTSGQQIRQWPVKEQCDLMIIQSIEQLAKIRTLAFHHQAPIVLLLNQVADTYLLLESHPELFFLLPIYTHNLEVMRLLSKTVKRTPCLYSETMKSDILLRHLLRTPGLLNRIRTTVIIRCYSTSDLIDVTLNSLFQLNKPAYALEILILFVEPSAENIAWAQRHQWPFIIADSPAYCLQLAQRLEKTDSHLVLCIDAGFVLSSNWLAATSAYIWDPMVAQVSTMFNHAESPEQRLPFSFITQAELRQKWQIHYQKNQTKLLWLKNMSDSLFLSKRHLFMRVLQESAELKPLSNAYTFSSSFYKKKLPPLLTMRSFAFSIM